MVLVHGWVVVQQVFLDEVHANDEGFVEFGKHLYHVVEGFPSQVDLHLERTHWSH